MRASKPWILGLALLVFAVARLTGAHLHLCYDGSEPPLQLHTADTSHLDHHESETDPHDDVDLDLDSFAGAHAKSAKSDTLLLALLPAEWSQPTLAERPAASVSVASLLLPVASGRHLRPPLRGPPA